MLIPRTSSEWNFAILSFKSPCGPLYIDFIFFNGEMATVSPSSTVPWGFFISPVLNSGGGCVLLELEDV